MSATRGATAPAPSTLPPVAAPVVGHRARVVSVPLEPRIVTAHYRIEAIEVVVLRSRDAEGRKGTATLWCFGLPQARVLVAALDHLARHALGPAGPVDDVLDRLRREINFFGFKGISVFALSAFDMALTDLACRADGRSLGQVLGRRRDAVPAYWSGLFGNQSQEEILDEVDRKLDEGYRAMKLRTGNPALDEDLRRVEAVAARLDGRAVLMLDAVQSWTVEQALAAVDRLAGLPVHWLEDPLVHVDYAGLRQVVERSPIPIATGENEYLSEGFAQLLEAGPAYLLADLQRVGGVREWRRVADLAATAGAVLTPHVYPHVALQLGCALDQAETWIEAIPWWDALVGEPLRLVDGAFAVPDEPGCGLDLDDEHLDRLAIGPWQELGR